jgi:hypothetical protein
MPMFGEKKFPYTPAGKKAAKMYAKAEGLEDKAMKMGAKKAKKKTVKKSAKKAMPKKMGKKK